MTTSQRISLCMIVRDEARFLPDCLASARDCVDEMIVVDTGSSDGTAEIAREHGARVVTFAWCDDFAAARNHGLEYVSGRWILHVDADERLAAGAAQAIRDAAAQGDFACGMLRLHNADRLDARFDDVTAGRARLGNPVYLPRLFCRTDDFAWDGIIHENVDAWLARQAHVVRRLDADIVHLGAAAEKIAGRDKTGRNLALLEKQVARSPDDIIPLSYLAMELLQAGRVDDARAVTERGWSLLPSQPPHRSPMRLVVMRARFALFDGRARQALETLALGERYDGGQPDFHYLRGFAGELLARGSAPGSDDWASHLRSALAAYRAAAAMHGFPGPGQFIEGGTSWAAAIRAGTVLLWLDRCGEALREFDLALAHDPGIDEALFGRIEALTALGRLEEAFAMIEMRIAGGEVPPSSDAWFLATLVSAKAGMRNEAELFLGKALARADQDTLAWHRRVRLPDLCREIGIGNSATGAAL